MGDIGDSKRRQQSHKFIRLCFQQGVHDILSIYRRRKCGFGASWDDEVIDSLNDLRIININLEVISYFVDAVPIIR